MTLPHGECHKKVIQINECHIVPIQTYMVKCVIPTWNAECFLNNLILLKSEWILQVSPSILID